MKDLMICMDDDMCDALQEIAGRRDLSVTELLRRFILLGMTIDKIDSDPRHRILIQEHYNIERLFTERELIL